MQYKLINIIIVNISIKRFKKFRKRCMRNCSGHVLNILVAQFTYSDVLYFSPQMLLSLVEREAQEISAEGLQPTECIFYLYLWTLNFLKSPARDLCCELFQGNSLYVGTMRVNLKHFTKCMRV